MIRIDFPEPTDPPWQAWRIKCVAAQSTLNTDTASWQARWAALPLPHDEKLKGKEKPEATDLYAAMKETVFMQSSGTFHAKCAYCEINIYPGMHGDVEHFRPKGKITDAHGNTLMVSVGGVAMAHPGYYWLAYDWKNLLPSCQLCNQPNVKRSGGRLIGKRNVFPLLVEADRATQPGQEHSEQPLLINPVIEDPEDYLELDTATGVLYEKAGSPRGKACIDILGLNDRHLPDERKATYDNTRRLLGDLVVAAREDPHSARTTELLVQVHQLKAGAKAYALASRLAIKAERGALEQLILLL